MITDNFNRQFDYLRVAVNEKCNFRCIYCMPEDGIPFNMKDKLLTDHEILRITSVLAENGITKVRVTGGEPLLRPGIDQLVKNLSQINGIESVHLTTNGVFLDDHIQNLIDSGLNGLNISLDTLKKDRFFQITRRNEFQRAWNNIKFAVSESDIPIKINVVLMRGINDDEIQDFINLAKNHPLSVRFIELMPFDDHQIWKTGRFMGVNKILDEINKFLPDQPHTTGSPTEEYYFAPDGFQGSVAVIPSFSRSFCGWCNRIRLTADGQIRNCLYSSRDFNLRDLIREGCSDNDIIDFIQHAMHQKAKDGFESEKSNHNHRTSMTQIGG